MRRLGAVWRQHVLWVLKFPLRCLTYDLTDLVRQGLLEYKESAECWRKALATFPSDGLTPAEQKQKQSCELELKTALQRAALTDRERVLVMPPHAKGEMPWDRAKALEAKLQAALPELANSSVGITGSCPSVLIHRCTHRLGSFFVLRRCALMHSMDIAISGVK